MLTAAGEKHEAASDGTHRDSNNNMAVVYVCKVTVLLLLIDFHIISLIHAS